MSHKSPRTGNTPPYNSSIPGSTCDSLRAFSPPFSFGSTAILPSPSWQTATVTRPTGRHCFAGSDLVSIYADIGPYLVEMSDDGDAFVYALGLALPER